MRVPGNMALVKVSKWAPLDLPFWILLESFSIFLVLSPFFSLCQNKQQCDGVENPHQLECLGWLDLAASLRGGCQASEPHNTVTYCYLTFTNNRTLPTKQKKRSTYCWELLPKEMVASQYCICYAHISDYVPNVCCKFQVCRSSICTSIPIPYTSWQVENRVCVFTPSTWKRFKFIVISMSVFFQVTSKSVKWLHKSGLKIGRIRQTCCKYYSHEILNLNACCILLMDQQPENLHRI